MRRLTGAIRNHVLNPTCSATDEVEVAAAVERKREEGGGVAKGGRCWSEPFMVDIRYDTSTEQVCVRVCAPLGCSYWFLWREGRGGERATRHPMSVFATARPNRSALHLGVELALSKRPSVASRSVVLGRTLLGWMDAGRRLRIVTSAKSEGLPSRPQSLRRCRRSWLLASLLLRTRDDETRCHLGSGIVDGMAGLSGPRRSAGFALCGRCCDTLAKNPTTNPPT